MAFTPITVTHTFNVGGVAATGSVTFQLSEDMTNGNITHEAGETIESALVAGVLSQVVPANDDVATVPSAPTFARWLVTVRLTGEQARSETYFVTVPHLAPGGTADLYTLFPAAPQVA